MTPYARDRLAELREVENAEVQVLAEHRDGSLTVILLPHDAPPAVLAIAAMPPPEDRALYDVALH